MDITKIVGNHDIDELFYEWYTHPEYNHGDNSAFYQHMPTLRLLCHGKHVVELGVRYGVSTIAILSARPKSLLSVDIVKYDTLDMIMDRLPDETTSMIFVEDSDLNIDPIDCDILFIDTAHNYRQLKAELSRWGNCAQEYLIFHDITSFGVQDEYPDGTQPVGLLPAIEEFLDANQHWSVAAYYLNNNGLLILRREPKSVEG